MSAVKRKNVFYFDDIARSAKKTKLSNEKKKEPVEEEVDFEAQELDELLALVDELPEMPQLDKGELEASISKFKRASTKNTHMRSLYPEDASKFMDSELVLNQAISSLHAAATAPQLYPMFIKQGAIKTLSELLTHENTDITISVIHLLRELTEPDSIDDKHPESIKAFSLYDALLEGNFLELLLDNLRRLNESEEDDFQAIFAILTIFDNIATVDEDYCALVVDKCKLFSELFYRMRTQPNLDENKLFCAEIMAVYVQTGNIEVKKDWAESNGFEKCLKLLNAYRNHEKLTTEEEEYVGNLFNIVIAGVPEAKDNLAKSKRAIPVLVEYIKEKKLFKEHALEALSISMMNCKTTSIRFVEEKGLKTIFGAFMKGKAKKRYKQNQTSIEEFLISIISSLFLNLSDIHYLRLKNKFREKEFEKIDRLTELHAKYAGIVEQANIDERSRRELNNLPEEDNKHVYGRLLGQGLVTLNLVDLVIGFVATAGESDLRERTEQLLNQQDMDFEDIKKTLREFALNIDSEDEIALSNIINNILKSL